jgi:hypothetical protein
MIAAYCYYGPARDLVRSHISAVFIAFREAWEPATGAVAIDGEEELTGPRSAQLGERQERKRAQAAWVPMIPRIRQALF